jgi:hypothetical protein
VTFDAFLEFSFIKRRAKIRELNQRSLIVTNGIKGLEHFAKIGGGFVDNKELP